MCLRGESPRESVLGILVLETTCLKTWVPPNFMLDHLHIISISFSYHLHMIHIAMATSVDGIILDNPCLDPQMESKSIRIRCIFLLCFYSTIHNSQPTLAVEPSSFFLQASKNLWLTRFPCATRGRAILIAIIDVRMMVVGGALMLRDASDHRLGQMPRLVTWKSFHTHDDRVTG